MMKQFTIKNRWLATIVLLITFSVGQMWGAQYFYDAFKNVGSNSNSYTSRSGWTLSNTYAHYNSGIRLGTSGGYATKTALTSLVGTKDLRVVVYAANWNNDASDFVVSVNGTAKIDGNSSKTFSNIKKTTSTGGAVTWDNTYRLSFVITGATSSTTITFGTNSSGKRVVLGPVQILDGDNIFYESFDASNGTGGNDGKWSGSIATGTLGFDNIGWSTANSNGANSCAKFGKGSSSGKGTATTPAITYSGSSNLVLTFKAAAWDYASEQTTLVLSATNATLDKSSVTLTKGAWNTYTVNISSITSGFTIQWAGYANTYSRFFLDEVCISEAAASCQDLASLNGSFKNEHHF